MWTRASAVVHSVRLNRQVDRLKATSGSGWLWGTRAVPYSTVLQIIRASRVRSQLKAPHKWAVLCLLCLWKAAATYPWPVQSLQPVRLQAVTTSESRKAEGPHHTWGLQLTALYHRVLWRIQYRNPLYSPEMGAKTVAVNTEAPKSPSITRGTQRLRDPHPPSAPCCRDITAGGCMLPQRAFC